MPLWFADVPNRRCVRVREGGEILDTVDADRGCFACMLGGADGATLFVMAAEWRGPDAVDDARSGQVLTAAAPERPCRPPMSRDTETGMTSAAVFGQPHQRRSIRVRVEVP